VMNLTLNISEDLLKKGFNVRVITHGSSMFPLLRTGDRITIMPEKSPAVGDIIVFRRENSMVCHRLVKTFDRDGIKYYQTRGDAFFGLDEPMEVERILGKVVGIDRGHSSTIRRLFLLFHPVLMGVRLNGTIVTVLAGIKRIFSKTGAL
jgi:signal peptidase I